MKNTIFKHRIFRLAFVLLGLTFIGSSCDVLDKQPLDAISEDAVFNDPTFLQNYVYNVYNGIRPPWNPGTGAYIGMTDIAVAAPDTHNRSAGIREYLDGNINS